VTSELEYMIKRIVYTMMAAIFHEYD